MICLFALWLARLHCRARARIRTDRPTAEDGNLSLLHRGCHLACRNRVLSLSSLRIPKAVCSVEWVNENGSEERADHRHAMDVKRVAETDGIHPSAFLSSIGKR